MSTESDYSKWGMLEALGITEDMLRSIIVNNSVEYVPAIDCDAPTYGVIMVLYHFTQSVFKEFKRKQNRLLKLLVDTLFPMFTISRADRLERKIRALCLSYESMVTEERKTYLQTQWRPQPTGDYSGYDMYEYIHYN